MKEATETRQLNATWDFELQPLTMKDITSVWSQDEIGVRHQCSFPDLEGCIVVMSFVGNTHSSIRDLLKQISNLLKTDSGKKFFVLSVIQLFGGWNISFK